MKDLFDISKINAIKDHFISSNETLAVAESVTAGLLQLAFSSADFASQYFQGGITAYNIGQKSRHLLIDPIHAIACNCVSRQISGEMAINVCKMFSSDWGIGITGYASPVPESNNELFCYFAIAHNSSIIHTNRLSLDSGTALEAQAYYVGEVINCLANCLADISQK